MMNRAPSSTDMPTVVNFLSDYTKLKGHCIVTGDFNCCNVNWIDLTDPYDGTEDTLLDFSVSHGFNQMVHKPTRGVSILDLILTNEPVAIFGVNDESPFSTSDHCQIEFYVFTDNNQNKEEPTNGAKSCKIYDWSNANHEGMADYFCQLIGVMSYLTILHLMLYGLLFVMFSTMQSTILSVAQKS